MSDAVVWSSSLTKKDIGSIERVQKSAFAIILGAKYRDYEAACTKLSMEKLTRRREKLALNFAKKSSIHPHPYPLVCGQHRKKP